MFNFVSEVFAWKCGFHNFFLLKFPNNCYKLKEQIALEKTSLIVKLTQLGLLKPIDLNGVNLKDYNLIIQNVNPNCSKLWRIKSWFNLIFKEQE